jgi:2-keto-4-pentenoate hydratase/2-oxohepta-3-ene-1,7-dioic acid hydratase in catechol pathway
MKINNIHCLALNYKGVGEINQDPIYFLKSTSCLAYEESEIKYPKFNTTEVWTEVELGISISEDCENINEEEAHNYIGGFFIAGDITCSNLYNRDHHLASSKARTGFCPISTNIFNIDLHNKSLNMKTYINGELKQHGNLSDIIFNPYKSVSYISKFVKLQKGDIILTGTPTTANGGPQFDCLVKPGDEIKHTIDGLGELKYKFSL